MLHVHSFIKCFKRQVIPLSIGVVECINTPPKQSSGTNLRSSLKTNMYRFNIELFFIFLIRLCDSSFGELPLESPLGIKEIRNKDETLFKLYKPDDNLMYPGKDEEKLEKIKNLWNTYYSCLKSKVQEEKTRKPVIIQIMEGQFTSYVCMYNSYVCIYTLYMMFYSIQNEMSYLSEAISRLR